MFLNERLINRVCVLHYPGNDLNIVIERYHYRQVYDFFSSINRIKFHIFEIFHISTVDFYRCRMKSNDTTTTTT